MTMRADFISAGKAAEIRPRGSYLRVGVFVNADEADVRAAASSAALDVVQLHGSLLAVPGLTNWRAMLSTDHPEADARVDAYLMDSFTPAFGGSGKTFDWSLARKFPFRVIVAGGLDAENVTDAIRIAEPWGVDSCSRLESSPGIKDWKKVSAFVGAALSAFHVKQAVEI